jgi:hypothetical protein
MVAPFDSRATIVAGDEKFEIAMNFRTISLAEAEHAGALTSMSTSPTLAGMTVLVWAFAQPAHPDLTLDQAMTLCVDHGAACGEALRQVISRGSAKGDGAPRPSAPARRSRTRSTR